MPITSSRDSFFKEVYKCSGENVDFQGVHFKGRVNVADIIGFSGSELISSKPDAELQLWTSWDLCLLEGSFHGAFSRSKCRDYKMHNYTKCPCES